MSPYRDSASKAPSTWKIAVLKTSFGLNIAKKVKYLYCTPDTT